MSRKRSLIHAATWSTLAVFLIIVGVENVRGEAKTEVRSILSSSPAQSRPIYQKPKPKLLFPKQLQQKNSGSLIGGPNPNLVTQTVYGFLDFVTTIGNTVMVFTPQTKKVEEVRASSVVPRETVYLQPTQIVTLPQKIEEKNEEEEEEAKLVRSGKNLKIEEEEDGLISSSSNSPIVMSNLESSESEILGLNSFSSIATPVPSSTLILSKVQTEGGAFIVTPEIRSVVNIVSSEPSVSSKGFTLKFSKNSPVKNNHEVHETIRVSQTLAPFIVTASQAPVETKKEEEIVEFFTKKSVVSSSNTENDERFNEELLENEEGVNSESYAADDESPELLPTPTFSNALIEPTPTSSNEETHYVLPLKNSKSLGFTPKITSYSKAAEIYASPVPLNGAYSRGASLFVDVGGVKSVDYVVSATPSRKQFTRGGSSRASSSDYLNRFSKNTQKTSNNFQSSSTTESNEVAGEVSSERTPSRFRSRNRSSFKSSSKESFSTTPDSNAGISFITPSTPSSSSSGPRKFSRNSRLSSSTPLTISKEFKTGQRGRGAAISPTTSTSIYRFKLNRPTGRWRFKPSPKPKVNIIKTKEEELQEALSSNNFQSSNGEIGTGADELQSEKEENVSNELGVPDAAEIEPSIETIRVSTLIPSDAQDKTVEIATIRSPYVFQAGNVKNTRYITLTKTSTIEPMTASAYSSGGGGLENILATRAPYDRILEGSNDVATLPLVVLGSDTATPPLETVTQTFSTTQLMLKTSILPVLYDGVTTLYTLTQSYFITRLVTAHKTVPPKELFQFLPTKSLTEFNTALQEAGSEHREQLVGSESETSENDAAYEHILAPPDELTSVGSDFDPSSMDEKYPKGFILKPKTPKSLAPKVTNEAFPDFSKLTPEQLAFLRLFTSHQNSGQPAHAPPPLLPQPNFYPQAPQPPQFTSSPVVFNTVTTLIETKTLKIQFGSKPSSTTIYSTKIVPTQVTSYVTHSVAPTAGLNFYPPAYPLAYVG